MPGQDHLDDQLREASDLSSPPRSTGEGSPAGQRQATARPIGQHQRRLGPVKWFLLWCSGVRRDILKHTPTEDANYVGLGGAVLTTATFAAVSSSAALAMALHKPVAHMVPFGIAWGLAILNLDRWLVATAGGANAKAKLISFVPRLALAVIIAFVIAEPLLLSVFDREIQAKMVELRTKDATAQQQRLAAKYGPLLRDVEQRTARLHNQLKENEARVQARYREAIGEAEGTSGTQLLGKGPVFAEKWRKYQQEQATLIRTRRETEQELATLRDRGRRIQRAWDKERAAGEDAINGNEGLLLRIEALSALTRENGMVSTSAWVLRLVIILIDSLAVLVKLLQALGGRRPFDEVSKAYQDEEMLIAQGVRHRAEVTAQIDRYGDRVTLQSEMADIDLGEYEDSVRRYRAHAELQSEIDDIDLKDYENSVLRGAFSHALSSDAPIMVGAQVARGDGARENGSHSAASETARGRSTPHTADRQYFRLQIGRAPDNDVVVDHPLVSWYHAAVVRDGQPEYRVNDLDSHGGTFVNGRRVTDAPLRDNDVLRIGYTAFRFLNGTLEPHGDAISGDMRAVGGTVRGDRGRQHGVPTQHGDQRRHTRGTTVVIVAAVIAAVATMSDPFLNLLDRRVLPPPTTQAPVTLPCDRSARPCGRILSPVSRDRVPRAFTVDGVLAKVPPNKHVYLAVQIGNLHWIKEPEIPLGDLHWSQEVVEAGNPPKGKFALVLVMVDRAGDQDIRRWLRGTRAGLRSIPGSTKLDVVRGVTLR
jgi:hypothetical protein